MKNSKNIFLCLLCIFFMLIHQALEGTELSKLITNIRTEHGISPKTYVLHPEDPIDVIIPCIPKDLYTLKTCIAGIRKNCVNIRRIIIISPTQIPVDAEWFDEALFPFNKFDVAYEIFQDADKARSFIQNKKSRAGWIYQQFLKLYAPFVIPDLSSNVLIVDADVIFIKPTTFMNDKGSPYFCTGTELCKHYFAHMKRVLPWMQRVNPKYSGVTHHMLFQKSILEDFFTQIEQAHQAPLWKALCHCIDLQAVYNSCMSEYEMYFNFCLLSTDQAIIRPLKWKNISSLDEVKKYTNKDYSFLSCHSYSRSPSKSQRE